MIDEKIREAWNRNFGPILSAMVDEKETTLLHRSIREGGHSPTPEQSIVGEWEHHFFIAAIYPEIGHLVITLKHADWSPIGAHCISAFLDNVSMAERVSEIQIGNDGDPYIAVKMLS